MRLFLLPISTRRTLIYCKQLDPTPTSSQNILDKVTVRAAKLWSNWEAKEKGWQKSVVTYGNKALKRIPYEEWGLKSIAPISQSPDGEAHNKAVEVLFPKSLIPEASVLDVCRKLGSERQAFHKSRMVYCFIGMPISAPFALIPIIPNLPFFYLCYRAWSHWRALSGSKTIMSLLENKSLVPTPSTILNELYQKDATTLSSQGGKMESSLPGPDTEADIQAVEGEKMVLSYSDCGPIANGLEVPDLREELERAISQVESALAKELEHEKASNATGSLMQAEANKKKKEE